MSKVYRVVCSENQKLYPNQLFVDFMPAGDSRPENCLNHECILKMRQMINPQVNSLESGILFYDYGDNNYLIKYEKVTNYSMRRYQEYIKQRLDKEILSTYQRMQANNKEKTLEVSLTNMAIIYDFYRLEDNGSHKSAQETALMQRAQEYKRQMQKRRELIEHKRNREVKVTIEQLLAWKQATRPGG